ncbi:unnamed protein product [Prorocentrum cordatum]|uniref:Secreted protein n=1 Tax=Prorocentrum cordatum TaxID=2364126 RepID=A0ABN9V6D1_9DINO|nr:unnamed protein product [Polarella glacialis]
MLQFARCTFFSWFVYYICPRLCTHRPGAQSKDEEEEEAFAWPTGMMPQSTWLNLPQSRHLNRARSERGSVRDARPILLGAPCAGAPVRARARPAGCSGAWSAGGRRRQRLARPRSPSFDEALWGRLRPA